MFIHCPGSTLFRICLFLMVCSVSVSSPSYGPPVSVKVGSPALLVCSSPCHGDIKWTLSKQSKELLAAACEKEVCEEGAAFKNRTKVKQENSSLQLDPAVYTDAGWYICYCRGSVLCEVHLDVFAPITIRASVGETVSLPCYAHTDKNAAGNDDLINWGKNGKLVVKLQQGKLSNGPGFEQRALVSASRYKDGDLSLTIYMFGSSDEGVYRRYHGNNDLGYPEAIILKASSSRLEQTDWPWWASLLVWILSLLTVLSFIAVFFWACQRRRSQGTDANLNNPQSQREENHLVDSSGDDPEMGSSEPCSDLHFRSMG